MRLSAKRLDDVYEIVAKAEGNPSNELMGPDPSAASRRKIPAEGPSR
jgi:hypothetical protein